MTYIEQAVKEFEKEFSSSDGYDFFEGGQRISEVKSFLLSALTKQAELYRWCVPEEKRDDVNVGGGQYGHPETDMDTGFNACRQATLNRMEKI